MSDRANGWVMLALSVLVCGLMIHDRTNATPLGLIILMVASLTAGAALSQRRGRP